MRLLMKPYRKFKRFHQVLGLHFARLWSPAKAALLWEIPATRYDRGGLYIQAGLLISFWSLMELRPAFTGHPIATGYAIAALALAAVVMAARTDRLTDTEKVFWIIISACLFIWELKVIDADHTEQDKQHTTDMVEQRDRFNQVLSMQNDTFRATLREFAREQEKNDKEFARVLTQQDRTWHEQLEMSEQITGRLVPGDSLTPHNACFADGENPRKGEILTIFGDNAVVTSRFPSGVLKAGNFQIISVDKERSSNEIAISLDFRDPLNQVALRLDKDGVVNRSALILLHPNKSTFLVQDRFGNQVMKQNT